MEVSIPTKTARLLAFSLMTTVGLFNSFYEHLHLIGVVCESYTWHSPQAIGWENQCFAVTDDYWAPVAQANHTSGQIFSLNIISVSICLKCLDDDRYL